MATSILSVDAYKGRTYLGPNTSITLTLPGRICLVTISNNYYGNYDVLIVCQNTSGSTLVIKSIDSMLSRWTYQASDPFHLTITSGSYDGSVGVTMIGQ